MAEKVSDLAGIREVRYRGDGLRECGLVLMALAGPTECPAHRVIDKNRPWRRNLRHDVADSADHQGGYPLALDNVRDETNGLVTIGSVGD